ncbi:ArsR/SmtB family transcription factor [Fontibacillus sp. BL9]|uniref:ArsR/SmtB family transcription factor n=1 Tax=Fontibacillus sp. BL9 TaxID=3389971 RepID=UPI00397B6BCB
MKVPLKKNISFAYNEAFELIVTMGMFACESQMAKAAEEYRIELDPLLETIGEDAKKKMSPHMLREMQFFFEYEFFHKALDYAFYESIASSPEPLSAEDWMALLKDADAEKMVVNMAYGVYYDKMEELLDGRPWEEMYDDLPGLIQRVRLISPLEEVKAAQEPLLECLAHPEETKQRYLQLITQFYRQVFANWSEVIRAESERAMIRYETFFQGDPERFIREIHKSDPDLFHTRSTFHVSFVSQVGNYHMWPLGRPYFWVIFGVHNDRVFGPAADREKAELFFKALSDKRRMDLIMLLRERPRYGSELAAELGITPAAVIYHANFFFFLDLVEFKRSDHRLYYHLNLERLRELLALTAKVMLE